MSSLEQPRADKPSPKPLLVVGAMLALAVTGAALTTRSGPAPAPARHGPPAVQVVVIRIERQGGVAAGSKVGARGKMPRPPATSWA